MANRILPSPTYLRQRLMYDAETGKLFWRDCPSMRPQWNATYAGKEAFPSPGNHGYRFGSIDNVKLLAHRVIWAMFHDEWPTEYIDHINGNRTDNRISNLRCVSRADNNRNKCRAKNNSSGVTGVGFYRSANKWRAQIKVDGKNHWLGDFADFQDAVSARRAAERNFGFHSLHGRG